MTACVTRPDTTITTMVLTSVITRTGTRTAFNSPQGFHQADARRNEHDRHDLNHKLACVLDGIKF